MIGVSTERGCHSHCSSDRDATHSHNTFAAFARRWFDTYVVPNNKLSEQQTKETILRLHLLPAFGARRLEDILPEGIDLYKQAKKAEGLSPKTINNQLLVLGKCLRKAAEWQVIDHAPRVDLLKDVPEPEIVFLTHDECDRLLTANNEQGWRDMALVGLRTGLRRGELLALRKSDINAGTRVLCVTRNLVRGRLGTPKSRKPRYIPLTADAYEVICRGPDEGFIFGGPNGDARSESEASKGIARLCARAGIRRVGWHALRHTFATQMSALEVPIAELSRLLGHASIATTMRYIHFYPNTLRGAIGRLEASLNAQHRV
jgi:integrase